MDAPQNFRNALNGFNKEDVVHYLEYLNAKNAAQMNQLDTELNASNQKVQQLQEELDSKSALADQSQELEAVKTDLENTKAQLESSQSRNQELEDRCQSLQTQLDNVPAAPAQDLQERLDRSAEENLSLTARCDQLQKELEEKAPVQTDETDRLNALLDSTTAENASLTTELEKALAENEALRQQCQELRSQAANAASAEPAPAISDKELEAYRRAERAERVATERADQVYQRTNLVLNNASNKIDATASDLSGAADRILELLGHLQASISASKTAVNDAVGTLYALRTDGKNEN